MYQDPEGNEADAIKKLLGFSIGIGLICVAVAAVIISGGALLTTVLVGAAIGGTINLAGQVVSNVAEGKKPFEDINYYNVALGAAAGAAFASGIGGVWGAVAIGALSNAGMSALEDKSWENIGFSAIVGGIAAFAGFKIGKYICEFF